jgi:hypothetical protein
MFFPMLTKTRLLTALLACGALSPTAFAQTIPPKTVGADAQAAPFRSAFEGYRAYTDDSVANWKAANETVEGIGGWRVYAKQAQSNDTAQPPAAAITTKPAAKAAP